MDVNSGLESQPDFLIHEGRLIEALRQGDEHAFAVMVERYHSALVRIAMAYVHDQAVAEDVAQEAWLGFLQSLPRFAERSSVKTWLFRILMNCARASLRRESKSVAFSALGDVWEEDTPVVEPERFLPAGHRWAGHWAMPPEAWPEEHLLEVETEAYVERAIAELPPVQRAVLTLRDVEGWSSSDVCHALDISEGNQRVLLHRARSHVRYELEAYMGNADGEGQ